MYYVHPIQVVCLNILYMYIRIIIYRHIVNCSVRVYRGHYYVSDVH